MNKIVGKLILVAMLSLGFQSVSLADGKLGANWEKNVVGEYEGQLLSSDIRVNVTTIFEVDDTNGITGKYSFYENGSLVTGELEGCQAYDSGRLDCKWVDLYGNGSFSVTFKESMKEFDGNWGFKGIQPDWYWDGKRE
jgi:hypothetical protein